MAGLMALMVLAAAGSSMPLRLEVTTTGPTHVIEVVGESTVPCAASYKLEVRDNGGGNRSVTAGTAAISPGKPQTVATVRLGPKSSEDTVAKLEVRPCGGVNYEQSWTESGK